MLTDVFELLAVWLPPILTVAAILDIILILVGSYVATKSHPSYLTARKLKVTLLILGIVMSLVRIGMVLLFGISFTSLIAFVPVLCIFGLAFYFRSKEVALLRLQPE